MDLIKKLFPYRSCTKVITGRDPRPCLEYYIHRCVAPCSGLATKEEYAQVVQQVIMFMEGNTEAVTRELKKKMVSAAEELEFERAAVLRDQCVALTRWRMSSKSRWNPTLAAKWTSSLWPRAPTRPGLRYFSYAGAS